MPRILAIVLIIFFIFGGYYLMTALENSKAFVTINQVTIEAKLADTKAKQVRGLSGEDTLSDSQGMLFIFPEYQTRNFWMKDMLFPIDTIWILDNKIIGIQKNIPLLQNGQITRYQSPLPVNYALEVKAGVCDKNNFKIGDEVKIIYKK